MYVRVFEYTAAPEKRALFEAAYGPDGDWARLFSRAEGYLDTILESRGDGRYRTQDLWSSQTAFEAFLDRYREVYETLDRACAPLKSAERHRGDFAEPMSDSPLWRPLS